ncbi:polyhydroxyalkanoate synthesis regulator DNA-binding domain-containing protein [Myxococcota bacterium]|nr:polyhydroxyalkanoate synthesis regulator DNA-binding domain-containing protein [Myxococcota bacterium]
MEAEVVRIIKRYPNRKLYDTTESKYITLKEVAALIRAGEMVTIVDNLTQEDLTHDFLLQIIRNQEKKWKLFPLHSLVDLIRSGTASSNDFLNSVRGEVDQRVADLPKVNDIKDMVESYHVKFEEWQKKIDAQIHLVLDAPSTLLSKEVDVLVRRLSQLESKVQDLKARLEKPLPATSDETEEPES